MNLDQLTIEIRPRRAWEAVDLGLLMARRWWWPMTKVWLLLTLPFFALLNLLPGDWLWLSYMLIWWFKPLFERPLLHILSQAVFNQAPDTRTTLKAFPSLAWKQIILSLTWRRLSPSRSMDLPVLQLEGLRGARRKQRLAILHREDASPANWLTIIGVHLEAFFGMGMAMLLYALIPSEIHIDWMELFTTHEAAWFVLLTNACNYLAMTMVAPFYVACGFSLYLNRRIKLEAWDIDIAFQRIVTKRRPAPARPLLMLALTLALGMGICQAPETIADVGEPAATAVDVQTPALPALDQPYSRDTAKASIETVAASEEFHQKTVLRYPSFFDQDAQPEKEPEEFDSDFWQSLFDFFDSAGKMASIASGLEILLWASILVLIFLVVFRYRHWLAAYLPQRVTPPPERAKPVTLFGMDLTRESLPADVSASALALWRAHKPRAALALLYRASLSRLLEGGLDIEDGYTEEECLQVAQEYAQHHPRARAATDYFSQLTHIWQKLAYGHIDPDAVHAETLCEQWNRIWQFSDAPQSQGAKS